MKSLKELLEKRAKHIADARAILDREKAEGRTLSAEERGQVDGLLNKAADMDTKIAERQESDRLGDRLGAFEARQQDETPRQTAYSIPGASPGKTLRGDEPMKLEVGRHQLALQPGTDAHLRA